MNWKQLFAATYNITKKDINIPEVDNKMKKKVPNHATFTGDKFPKQGDPAKIELNDWHQKNKEYKKSKEKEKKSRQRGSPLMSPSGRYEKLDDIIKGGKIKYSWEKKLYDLLQTRLGNSSKNTEKQNCNCDEEKITTNILKEKNGFKLISKECKDFCGISIVASTNEEIESYKVKKNGHKYEELIPVGVWESKFDLLLKDFDI